MQIQVLDNEKIVFDNDVKKDSVILGRGSDCDIRCISETISRHHLEIKKDEGKVFIKNMSKNNWSMLNEDKIPTGEFVEYFAFYQLFLPGNIEVKVILEDEEALKQVSSAKYKVDFEDDIDSDSAERKGPRKPFRPKLADAAKNKKPYKAKTEISEMLKMVFGLLIVLGFFAFQYKDRLAGKDLASLLQRDKSTKRNIELKKELWAAKKKRQEKMDPKVKAAVSIFETVKKVEDPLLMKKCQSSKEMELCDLIVSDRRNNDKEGVAIKGDSLFGFIGISSRKYNKFSTTSGKYPGLKGIPDKYFYRLLASYYFMDPKVFYKIRDKGINNVFIYVLDDIPMVPSAKAIYKINFQKKINYNQVDFNLAIDGILMRAMPDYFNKYLARYIIKVK